MNASEAYDLNSSPCRLQVYATLVQQLNICFLSNTFFHFLLGVQRLNLSEIESGCSPNNSHNAILPQDNESSIGSWKKVTQSEKFER